MAPKVMGVAVASKRYENDACEWAEGRQVPRDVRSSPPERENHSRWVSHSRGKKRGLSVAPSLHTNAGRSTSCSLREKLGVGEEICSHCGEKGAVPPVQPAPVSVVIVGSPLMVCQDHRGVDQALAAEGGDPEPSEAVRSSWATLIVEWGRGGVAGPGRRDKNRAVDRRVSRVPE